MARIGGQRADTLAGHLDDAPVRRTPDSDLLHDVVVGPATSSSTEIRLAWDDAVEGRTALVAVRNPPGPPPLPDDPWADLLGTIHYEVVTSPRGRVSRRYVEAGTDGR